jgi:hypothetical protein
LLFEPEHGEQARRLHGERHTILTNALVVVPGFEEFGQVVPNPWLNFFILEQIS